MLIKKFFLLILFSLLLVPIAFAHCPVCVAGAGAGVGIARAYGIDDSIVGLFLGALIVSSALWVNILIKKKWPDKNFVFRETLLVLSSFLLFVVPLYLAGIISEFSMVKSMPEMHAMNIGILGLGWLGVDKLLFGIILGSLTIWFAFFISDKIKEKRGKVLWPYQSISFMFIVLAVLTLMLWILTKIAVVVDAH